MPDNIIHDDETAYTPKIVEEADRLYVKHMLEVANTLIARVVNGTQESAYPTSEEMNDGFIESYAKKRGLGFPYCTPKQASAIISTSDRTVRRMCETGELRAVRVGSCWRINTSEMLKHMCLV